MAPLPLPLPENAGLAFVGELSWAPAVLTDREARKMLAATNTCGRPNRDVMRRWLAVVAGEPVESWVIDFPEHYRLQEAALYAEPFGLLRRHFAQVGISPYYNPDLRLALARTSRWLAMPVAADEPDWRWIEDEVLPDASLLVVARDDDFTHGVLQSSAFAVWYATHRHNQDPTQVVESFPFPWPPGTSLSALTKEQEDQRFAIARAARDGNPDVLNTAVLAAYGWPIGLRAPELVAKLTDLNYERAAEPGIPAGILVFPEVANARKTNRAEIL